MCATGTSLIETTIENIEAFTIESNSNETVHVVAASCHGNGNTLHGHAKGILSK